MIDWKIAIADFLREPVTAYYPQNWQVVTVLVIACATVALIHWRTK